MDLLCEMWWTPNQGQITSDLEGFSRMIGTSQESAKILLREIIKYRVCDVVPKCPDLSPNFPGEFTIINRRMDRDFKRKEYERLKKQRQREERAKKSPCPSNVPLLSSSSESSSEDSSSSSSSRLKNMHKNALPPQHKNASVAEPWPDPDLWLKEFLENQKIIPLENGSGMLDHKWWELTSEACGGVDLETLQKEFAKIGAWLTENPGRTPRPKGWRRFVRGWLERSYDRERRFPSGRQK